MEMRICRLSFNFTSFTVMFVPATQTANARSVTYDSVFHYFNLSIFLGEGITNYLRFLAEKSSLIYKVYKEND